MMSRASRQAENAWIPSSSPASEGPSPSPALSVLPHPEPLAIEEKGSYAAPDAPTQGIAYYWSHSLAEILGALLAAGLHIESLAEYPFMGWAYFPWTERLESGWRLPPGNRRASADVFPPGYEGHDRLSSLGALTPNRSGC